MKKSFFYKIREYLKSERMNVSLEYLRSVLERRRMFNCVPVIITYDNFSRFFPSPYPSFLSLSSANIIIPLLPYWNVDTGHCPCATRGTKRWINTRLNKQLLSLLFPAFFFFFSLFSRSILPIFIPLDRFHAWRETKEYASYNCDSNVSWSTQEPSRSKFQRPR